MLKHYEEAKWIYLAKGLIRSVIVLLLVIVVGFGWIAISGKRRTKELAHLRAANESLTFQLIHVKAQRDDAWKANKEWSNFCSDYALDANTREANGKRTK